MRVYLYILSATCVCASLAGAPEARYDLVIRGGRVFDGTGNPPVRADVAVEGDRIVKVGRIPGKGLLEVDAPGQAVAPGFIDVHTHSERITSNPQAENFLRMGVTTIVTGNCGGSALDVGEFLKSVDASGVAVNVATLVGHNTVRSAAMRSDFDRPTSASELEAMKEMVDRAMRDGAVGLSTGLIYQPGIFSKTAEIAVLAKVASAHGGIYATHMRHEDSRILESLAEVFRICKEADIRAEVSHLKLSGPKAWGRTSEVLAALERARAEGLEVTHDAYAYTRSSTGLDTVLPEFATEGGLARLKERLADPAQRKTVADGMRARLRASGRDDYGYVTVASCPPEPALNGMTIPAISRQKRSSASLAAQIETILDMLSSLTSGRVSAVFESMREEDVQEFLRHPYTMIASDGGPQRAGPEVPHPRSYGNNARALGRYVRDLKLIRLEDAVRKMTSLPAAAFRLPDRGLLRPGFRADLVVFDAEKVRDEATYADPHRFAGGFSHAFVNGVAALRGGAPTSAGSGRALRHR